PGHGVNVQPEPDSTPGRESLRNLWRDRRTGDRRHPRPWFLRHEIRARPGAGDDRFPQNGSALPAEVAAAADLSPELLGRVRSAARLAERRRWSGHITKSNDLSRMNTNTMRASSFSKHEHVKPGGEIVRWKVWTLVDSSRPTRALL